VEFHHHEIPHPAEEAALFHRFHHNQRTLFNRLTVKLEINRPDHLAFFQRGGELRVGQGIAGLQVFQLTARNGYRAAFTRAQIDFALVTKPDALADERGIRFNRRHGFIESGSPRSAVFLIR
jgi:hypothetical protein